jgi:hypothetical protein
MDQEIIILNHFLDETQEKNFIKAILRYSHVTYNLKYLIKAFKKVKISNFLIGFFSYFRLSL